jgi:putative transposase
VRSRGRNPVGWQLTPGYGSSATATTRTEAQMARLARIVIPNYPLHITQRGHNRETTFRDEHDFARYYEMLLDASRRTSCMIHAYALMTNHVHLLVTPRTRLAAARLLQRTGSQFVAYWNKRHRRSGTLWNGRFKSSVVDTDRYFLACSRYIDLNPVRAGLVERAELYNWSSHRHLAYGVEDALLTSHVAYDAIASTARLRQLAYQEYCMANAPARSLHAIRSATQTGAATGDARFATHIQGLLRHPATRQAHGGDRKSEAWRLGAQ